LPGPPKEMQPMFEECCELYLNAKSDKVLVSIIIKCLSKYDAPIAIVGESPVADRLAEILDGVNPTVATYAKEDAVLFE
ncbi:MAG: damage-inducible protein CinA, partial [Selenomonadaceae bacterium]|nr:damage-inducible protein CinA [Selenomonadaceae bacterium]